MRSRVRYGAALWLVGLALVSACGGARVGASQASAVLVLRCPVSDAKVWIDGRFAQQASVLKRGIRLRPGAHRIEVRHQEYYPTYIDVSLSDGERKTVSAELAPRL